jgi:hypothetical protein
MGAAKLAADEMRRLVPKDPKVADKLLKSGRQSYRRQSAVTQQ